MTTASDAYEPPRDFRAVALGGGHGLHASLSALRTLTDELTAVVTVADDGGSSGRIRREFNLLPPGDLRMALAALAGASPQQAGWAQLLQHRFGGEGALAGHPVGNLLLTGLLETVDDPVQALAQVAQLVGAVGRVLPMSPLPLDLIAEVDSFDPDDPVRTRLIRGQSSIASTPGRVRSVQLLPAGAPACAPAVDAVREADLVVLGPGSWFTSVIPHLLLRELSHAIANTKAVVVVVLNLVPQSGETDGFSEVQLLRALHEHQPALRCDAIIADQSALLDPLALRHFADDHGAHLVVCELAVPGDSGVHDPKRLAGAVCEAMAGVVCSTQAERGAG